MADDGPPRPPLIGCPTCGQVQQAPAITRGQRLHCARCHGQLPHTGRGALPIVAATIALCVAPAALLLPIIQTERLGERHASSIISAVGSLARHGEIALAGIIAIFSIALPLAKLTGLLVVLTPALWQRVGCAQRQRWIYHAIEYSGRWGMVDVLLVALLVAIVKVGDLITITPGPGLVAFTIMVLGSLIAGLSIHPHHLWNPRA